MTEIPNQEVQLAIEGCPNRERGGREPFTEPRMVAQLHREAVVAFVPFRYRAARLWRSASISRAELKGPWTRSFRTSSRACASSRSIMLLGVRVIFWPSTFASRRSPTATPACFLTEVGRGTWYLVLTVTSGMAGAPVDIKE